MLQLDSARDLRSTPPAELSKQQVLQLRKLLDASSRTFALTIPVLPEGLQGSVELAYLLLRAADAIEDATHLPLAKRLQLLRLLQQVLLGTGDAPFLVAECERFAQELPAGGERSVLLQLDLLLLALDLQSPAAAEAIRSHCERVVHRMAYWLTVGTKDGKLKLRDFGELSDYMYSVAGIVGELLTHLFTLQSSSSPHLPLMARSADFGAGLQLTNIIKDSAEDAKQGRQFLPDQWVFVGCPDGVDRLEALIDIARLRLRAATNYTSLLSLDEPGVRLFCFIPIVLALATLAALAERSDEAIAGASVKVDRAAVPGLLLRAKEAVASNDALEALHEELDRAIDTAWGTP